MNVDLLNVVITQFNIGTSNLTFKSITHGYINDTYLVEENFNAKYVLQRVNKNVFKNINGLHKNIENALKKLDAKDYARITLFKTKNSSYFYLHENSYWRLLSYIPNSKSYSITSNPEIAFEAGRVISSFHKLLIDEEISNYVDTVPDLNNLPLRINQFESVLSKAPNILKNKAKSQIVFAKQHIRDFDAFYNADLPYRICHNDTKLNNFLFSKNNKGLCLVDLDTIMKGYFHYDFGDAVRTIVSEAFEDEKNLSKINFNLELLDAFVKGISYNDLQLSKLEISFLPLSCALMPFMHGLRALTDYLNGNIYYKITYPEQNLDRCKSLFKFSKLALNKQNDIESIITRRIK